jgi:adenosylmethionine-8-amino-7-oxononanoate aminotransferase
VGAHLQARLGDFVSRHAHVGDVRGVGLMACIEMVESKQGRKPLARGNDLPQRVARATYRRGAMVRVSGPNIILSPPLIITREEVDVLVDALDAAFTEVEAGL